jgi:multidrug efflux pump subunit AcrA (membrane-fusion protein)
MSIEGVGLAFLSRVLFNLVDSYIDFVGFGLSRIRISAGLAGARIAIEPKSKMIDSRLAKIDLARGALEESLAAIEQLKIEAENNKIEHQKSQRELDEALSSKDDAERKLVAVRSLIAQDIEAFQVVAGVPNVRRERLIGFASGVIASTIATALWVGGSIFLKSLGWIS